MHEDHARDLQRLAQEFARYPNTKRIVWCQEEPKNQGAWYQIRHRLQEPLSHTQELLYSGRAPAAAPAPVPAAIPAPAPAPLSVGSAPPTRASVDPTASA